MCNKRCTEKRLPALSRSRLARQRAAELGVSVEEVKRRLDFLEKKQIEWSMTDAEWESFMDCWAEVEAEAKAFGLDFETYVPLAAKEGKA